MEIKGDFIGFSFGGVHSKDLGFIRVSGGDRYDEELQPDVKDVTAEVPGMDGQYYFGSTFGPKTIDIEIAFDSMTEEQFRRMRKVFGRKSQGELIFDERPYKKYLAKIESPIELSYICFDERDFSDNGSRGVGIKNRELRTLSDQTRRIYKGEGKITFVCYFPFAKSVFKVLQSENINSDWAVSSGLLTDSERTGIDVYGAGAINVYNAGDLPTGFRLYLPGAPSNTLHLLYSETGAELVINSFTLKTGDVGVIINTDNQLIQGLKTAPEYNQGILSYMTSGNIYNEYVDSGYFFKLEPNSKTDNATITIDGGMEGIQIFYDYLYF